MSRTRLVPMLAVLTLALGVALTGCGSDNNSKSSNTTAAGGGVTVAPTTTAASTGGNKVAVVVGDTSGLNGPMTLTATPASVKAGKITFTTKNTGTIKHEMVVLKLDPGQTWDTLPVTNDKVSEKNNVGEAGDVAVGETKSVTIDLKAGNYALVCNIAKHYAMGMRAQFTVT
jgi:uncharacterized cupredoxin-like copper-binding protein